MKGLGMRKAMGYNMSSITNSPVNGLLYVRGKISAFSTQAQIHSIAACAFTSTWSSVSRCTQCIPAEYSVSLFPRQAAVQRRHRAMCQ